MSNLLESLLSQFSGNDIEKMSSQLGLSKESTQSALGSVAPILLGALARNAQKSPQEAQALENAIESKHSGSVLDNLGGFLQSSNLSEGEGILRHVLGSKSTNVAQYVGSSAGIESSKAGDLMKMVAPVVLGFLGKTKKEQPGSSSVGDILGSFLKSEKSDNSKSQSIFEQLLDRDNDGDVMDDVAELGKGLLGKFLK